MRLATCNWPSFLLALVTELRLKAVMRGHAPALTWFPEKGGNGAHRRNQSNPVLRASNPKIEAQWTTRVVETQEVRVGF